jgi:hypothetical protein
MIEARDCDFHVMPPEYRETWAESNYFPFHIPAAGLSGCVYTIFRPGLGVCMSDVTIFDRRADHWEGLAYTDNQQHIPCPPSLSMSIGVQTGPTLRAYRRAKGDHFRRGGEACASIKMRSACRARGGGRA